MKKSEVVYFTNEQIIDFLLVNWTTQMRFFKEKDRRKWLETEHPHDLLAMALSFCKD